jgi:tetratricopeptide (TPR) repeat protein
MKKLILLLLLITQLLCSQENELFEEAEILIDKKQYEKAIKTLEKVLEVYPNFVGAYVSLGKCKTALNLNLEAIDDYTMAVSLDSLNTLSFFNIANAYKNLEDLNKAVYYYTKAEQSIQKNTFNKLENNPLKRTFFKGTSPFYVSIQRIQYKRGITFYDLEDYLSAFKDFCATESHEVTKESKFMLAVTLLKLKRNKEACINLEKAITLGSIMAADLKKKHCK